MVEGQALGQRASMLGEEPVVAEVQSCSTATSPDFGKLLLPLLEGLSQALNRYIKFASQGCFENQL